MLKGILLSLVLSADAFGVGLSFGTAGIKMGRSSKAVLSAISLLFALFSITAGGLLFSYIPQKAASSVSSLMLIIPGALIIKQSLFFKPDKKSRFKFFDIINTPESCNSDLSKKIELKEAVFLSLALSADNTCAIASCGFDSGNIFYMPFFLIIFQLFLLDCGISTGAKIKDIHKESREKWIFISGILLIMMGISNLF